MGLRAVVWAGGAVELGFGGREGRRVGGGVDVVVGVGIGFGGGVGVDSVRHGRTAEEQKKRQKERGEGSGVLNCGSKRGILKRWMLWFQGRIPFFLFFLDKYLLLIFTFCFEQKYLVYCIR